MGKFNDLTGMRFGRLTVIEDAGTNNGYVLWRCRCDCGYYKIIPSGSLTSGNTKSCGCLLSFRRETKGNLYRNKLHKIWLDIPKPLLCDEWSDFHIFREWAIQNQYVVGWSLIRIDDTLDYRPDNCKWVKVEHDYNDTSESITKTPMNKVKREPRVLPTPQPPMVVEIDGESHTIAEWSEITGLSKQLLYSRYNYGKRGKELIAPKQQRGRSS